MAVVVLAKAKMKEANILLVQEMMPTIVSSSFIKSLKILIENNVPETNNDTTNIIMFSDCF